MSGFAPPFRARSISLWIRRPRLFPRIQARCKGRQQPCYGSLTRDDSLRISPLQRTGWSPGEYKPHPRDARGFQSRARPAAWRPPIRPALEILAKGGQPGPRVLLLIRQHRHPDVPRPARHSRRLGRPDGAVRESHAPSSPLRATRRPRRPLALGLFRFRRLLFAPVCLFPRPATAPRRSRRDASPRNQPGFPGGEPRLAARNGQPRAGSALQHHGPNGFRPGPVPSR
jgi:hypothetical protein